MSAGAGTKDNAELLLGLLGFGAAATEPAVLAESGKAGQGSKTTKTTVILTLKGKSGASKIQVGPTEKVEGYELAVEIPASTQQTVTIPLPAGWWIKTTMAEGSIAKAVVVPV